MHVQNQRTQAKMVSSPFQCPTNERDRLIGPNRVPQVPAQTHTSRAGMLLNMGLQSFFCFIVRAAGLLYRNECGPVRLAVSDHVVLDRPETGFRPSVKG